MIDYFNVSDNALYNQVFYTKGSTDWQIFQKPNYCRLVSIFCIGGGGGGGAGQQGAGSTSRRGGGGGGSAGYSLGIFSASQIPDTLFVQPAQGGSGGVGGATGSAGSSGGISYVSIAPNTTSINILVQSGASGGGGGTQGSSTGAGGSAGSVWAGSILNNLGLVTSVAGQVGSTGQVGSIPTAIAISSITTAGGGGGGYTTSVAYAGGNITGAGFVPTITGGTGFINSNGTDGDGGYMTYNPALNSPTRQPLVFTGGAGGGCSNNFIGGAGGNGAFGCGGGGGGAGVTSSAGNGGKGGDGIMIISCF